MSVDVACAGRAFVDLTFAGLDALPVAGEERFARDLLRSPGGAATTAVGAARLGLRTALASPLGDDPDGRFLRAALEAEQVRCTGRTVARTPVTVVLPSDGDRAMATFEPTDHVSAAELQALAPAAVVVPLPHLALAPAGARVYVNAGDEDARSGALPGGLRDARALLLNAREARLLTGEDDPGRAAQRLAERTPTAVVTVGPDGAVAASGGRVVRSEGLDIEAVDTTGAGDLFAAAYVWADAAGATLEERLAWAVTYAALSVRTLTAIAGAATLTELADAGARRGLRLPQQILATKEGT